MKKIMAFILTIAFCCSLFVGIIVPTSASEMISSIYSEKLAQNVIDYMEGINGNAYVPVWIYLTTPSTAEIEAIVKEKVSEELSPQEYYEERLNIIKEIYSDITDSFIEKYLDNSCIFYYQSSYTATLAIEVSKEKVLELAENDLVVEISLYKDFEIEPEIEEVSKLSPELQNYLNSADINAKVPVWVNLTPPSTAEIEAAVKKNVSDNLSSQEYYEERNKVIKEIYSKIISNFVQNHLSDNCTILYQSQYTATIAIEAPKDKVLELEWLDTIKELSLFTDYEILPETNKLLLAFKDLPEVGTWQYEAIAYCVEHGIMNGMSTTEFSPNGNLTRGQLVTVLYRVAGQPEIAYEKVFPDVAANQYYTLPIIWAAKNGIVNGFEDGTFRPNTPVTREELATILYRYSGSPDVSGDLSAYPDASAVQSYSKIPMLWATQNGFLPGETEEIAMRLAPRANAARVQIASFIMRYLESK